MQTIAELVTWVRQLDPPFAFLLGLPVLVAAAGLAAEALRRRSRRPAARAGAAASGELPGGAVQAR